MFKYPYTLPLHGRACAPIFYDVIEHHHNECTRLLFSRVQVILPRWCSCNCQLYDAWWCIGVGSNFILGGAELVGAAPLGGVWGHAPSKNFFFNFTHSEIVSRAILQELDDMVWSVMLLQESPVHCCSWNKKVVAQLGLEALDSMDVLSSSPKQSIPEVHGLVGSPALKSTLLSPPY